MNDVVKIFRETGVRKVTLTCPKHGQYTVEQAIVGGKVAHTPECPMCAEER